MASGGGRMRMGSIAANERAMESTREAERRRELTEERLSIEEGLLGTEGQVSGQLGVDQRLLPYTQRYEIDRGLLGRLGWGYGGAVGPTATPGDIGAELRPGTDFRITSSVVPYFETMQGQANDLMTQAQQAAQTGDYEAAERLRLQASEIWNKGFGGAMRPSYLDAINLVENPDFAARAQLSSPMAQTVGGLVKQGREFLDPTSETSQRFKTSLTEAPLRALASGERSLQRGARDQALGLGGGARRPGTEAAIANRASEEVAAGRAQVLAQANAVFEQFSRQFAGDTAKLGQSWLQNQSGIREQYQSAVDALQLNLSQISENMSARFASFAAADEAAAAARKDFQRQMLVAGAGLALGIGAFFINPALGAAIMGGAGGMMGNVGGGGGDNVWDIPPPSSGAQPPGAITIRPPEPVRPEY